MILICRFNFVKISSVELVPGDLIRLRLGDSVPADAQLLQQDSVQVDESMVTGESLPRVVPGGDEVMCGTVVVRGIS